MNQKVKRAAIVRGCEWDSTQAGPRAIRVLQELGCHVDVYCWDTKNQHPAEETIDGVRITRYKRYCPAGSAWYFIFWPLWWFWLIRKYWSGNYDLLHVMNLDPFVPAAIHGLYSKTKVLYDIRDPWGMCLTGKPFPIPQLVTLLDKIVSPFADGLLLSQGNLDACRKYFGPVTPRVVPTVQVLNVPELLFDIEPKPPRTDEIVINYSGRLSTLRGAKELLELTNTPGVSIDAYGKIYDEELLKSFESNDKVKFDRLLPFQEAIERMNNCTLVSLLYAPSLTIVFIASANKMFESMMLGKPYLCTKGSFPHLVAQKYDLGWGIDYESENELLDLVQHLKENPEEIISKGENGRRAFVSHFQWEKQKQNLLLMYSTLLDKKANEFTQNSGWKKFLGSSF